MTSVSEAVTLCLVIALQKLVKPVVRRDSYGGLFVIIGQIRNGSRWGYNIMQIVFGKPDVKVPRIWTS